MSAVAEIKSELSGNTNFDEDHEDELFERIAEVEDEEAKGELVPGLTKADYVLIVIMLVALGFLPLVYYAVMYF